MLMGKIAGVGLSLILLLGFSCCAQTANEQVASEVGKSSSPVQTPTPMNDFERKVFEESSPEATIWKNFFRDGRYHVAKATDFNFPADARGRLGTDISRATEFACTAGDINGDGLSDRACIIVDSTRNNDPMRFSLIVINGVRDNRANAEVQWVHRDRDLSRTLMGWSRDGLGVTSFEPNGDYNVCHIKWQDANKTYGCM